MQAKEDFALRAIFNALYDVGLAVTNAEEAMQAIDLAAGMMSYVLKRKVNKDEVRARMAQLIEEWMMEAETKH